MNDAAIDLFHESAHRSRAVEEAAQNGFAFAQGFLGALGFGDIGAGHDRAAHAAFGIEQRHGAEEHVDGAAAREHHVDLFLFHRPAGGRGNLGGQFRGWQLDAAAKNLEDDYGIAGRRALRAVAARLRLGYDPIRKGVAGNPEALWIVRDPNGDRRGVQDGLKLADAVGQFASQAAAFLIRPLAFGERGSVHLGFPEGR